MQQEVDWTAEPEAIAATVGHPPGTPPGLYDRLKYVSEVLQALAAQGLAAEGPCLAQRRADQTVGLDALICETVIGRSDEAAVSVADERLSRRHFRLSLDVEVWCIQDLGSTNGTRVNGETLAGIRSLCSGDLIEAGSTVFVFIESEP